MAKTYTYDDFRRALEESGLGGQFSQADLALAQRNPDAGMSLLSYKTDYANATTPELRALANQGAESVRSSYGGYTGGGDGGSFKLNPMSPNQFAYGEAPSFTDNYADQIQTALQATRDRDPYSYSGTAPVYDNRYDPQIQQTISDILGRGEFTYDPKTDPVYSAYQKQYAREGQRATANAMGEAAAMTGGMPSSWAMTAASQAGDYYASQMADKIPELYEDAYNRYLQEYQMKLSDLSALRGLESDDYAKYRDQLSQYNTDRSFDYSTWLDRQNLAQQDLENLRALRSDDLDLYRTALGQYNTDRSFDYSQWLDEITNQRTQREDERSWAQDAAKAGDYSLLQALGINTSQAEYADALSRAMQAAEVGDYGQLRALGIDTSNAQTMSALEQAYKQAQIANVYAGMDTEEDKALERAYRQAQIANVYAGMPTEEERALEQAYKQAQIAKLLSGDSSGTSGSSGSSGSAADDYFDSLSSSKKLDYATAAYKNFGDSSYLERLGMNVGGTGAGSAGGMAIRGVGDLSGTDGIFAAIREMKNSDNAAERAAVDTQGKVKALVQAIPGYDAASMDEMLKEFIAELFGRKTKSST